MTPVETKKLIEQNFDEVFNKGNLDFADRAYAPTAVLHDPATPDVSNGPEGIKQFATVMRKAFPDLHMTVDSIIVEGNQAAARWTATGTHKGEFRGIAPTGKFGTVTGISMTRIENDRFAEIWVNWDLLGVLRTIGVELPVVLTEEAHI